jgi:hypothetical protein
MKKMANINSMKPYIERPTGQLKRNLTAKRPRRKKSLEGKKKTRQKKKKKILLKCS